MYVLIAQWKGYSLTYVVAAYFAQSDAPLFFLMLAVNSVDVLYLTTAPFHHCVFRCQKHNFWTVQYLDPVHSTSLALVIVVAIFHIYLHYFKISIATAVVI